MKPESGDALVIVDLQYDFLPGGSLGVPDGDQVISVINRYIKLFRSRGLPVLATRDWHPEGHCSFESEGGTWPRHCVAGTHGAELTSRLELPDDTPIISKAQTVEEDAYSGFQGTDLADRLRSLGVTRVFIGGLATDYCVLNTVKDALSEGFEAVFLDDASRAVDLSPGDGDRAVQEMKDLGAAVTEYASLQ